MKNNIKLTENGTLYLNIDSFKTNDDIIQGEILTEFETYELFLKMKEYYKKNNPDYMFSNYAKRW